MAEDEDQMTADAPPFGDGKGQPGPCPVIGIGASAGGFNAFKAFLERVPRDSGFAYVFIPHLVPEHRTRLGELLGNLTELPVTVVREDTPVEPDHVFVLAENRGLIIRDGVLRPQPLEPRAHRAPVNLFLLSLAEDQGGNAACIILSGAGSDGTTGLSAIKEAGGLTLAQSADTAEHDSMLLSAVDTGLVDFELPVEDMPARLADFFRNRDDIVHGLRYPDAEPPQQYVAEICTLLRTRTGHDFHGYKEKSLLRRIERRMQILQVARYSAFVERLRRDPQEIDRLFKDLLIGVTQFFRDPDAFEVLQTQVIPQLLEGKGAQDTVRIWVPACSTGEEAYSIAMLVCEHLGKMASPPKLQLFASDINETALQVARTGFYPGSIGKDVPPERLDRFFIEEEAGYRVRSNLRECCLFSPHNLLRDPPFSRIDLISCRNVLIYLNADLQHRLLPVLHYALLPGGVLFLGPAETVSRHARLFASLDKKHRIFRRREDGLRGLPRFPVTEGGGPGAASPPRRPVPGDRHVRSLAERVVLEHYAPAHVVVNEDLDIVEASRGTGAYLELGSGRPDLNILSMVRLDLRLDLRAALHKAVQTGGKVVHGDIGLANGGSVQKLRLIVDPLPGQYEHRYFLVLFQPHGPAVPESEAQGPTLESEVVQQLERELRLTKERLQATTEELETSTEELETSNEELKSSNEELKSSNEELLSLNEELQTVNTELNSRVEELGRANSDLRNLLATPPIATLFLGRDLGVKSFTPAARELYFLRDTDIGRPITEITSRLDEGDIGPDIRHVLGGGPGIQREVSVGKGSTVYIMRAHPYRTGDEEIDGAILTFTDITERKRWERHQELLLAELSHRVKNMLATIQAITAQTIRFAPSLEAFHEMFTGRLQALAIAHSLLTRTNWRGSNLEDLVQETLKAYEEVGRPNVVVDCPDQMLSPKRSVVFALILHELATNAAKYGAFSTGDGRVEVRCWTIEQDGVPMLRLSWREHAGLPIAPPEKKGFGLMAIEQSVVYEMNGTVDMDFAATGLHCVILIPAEDEQEHENST